MKTKDEILANLPNFYRTENYYALSPLFRSFILTDGAKYLADAAGAWWLMDAVASHLGNYKNEGFVVAKLLRAKASNGWILRLEDGNDEVLADQIIEYSNFPLDEITLYVIAQDDRWIVLLPSEY